MVLLAQPVTIPPQVTSLQLVRKTPFKNASVLTLSEEQRLFSLNLAKLIEYIYSKGHGCTLAEAYRTPQQAVWDAQHGTGIVNSLHCKRLAIDLDLYSPSGKYLIHEEDYRQFGEYWETLHPKNRWGGRFKRLDADHFEMQE